MSFEGAQASPKNKDSEAADKPDNQGASDEKLIDLPKLGDLKTFESATHQE